MQISDQKGEINRKFKLCNNKKQLLALNTRRDITEIKKRLSKIPGMWDDFEIAIEAYNDILEQAKEKIREEIDRRIMDTSKEVDKFSARWTAVMGARQIDDWSPGFIKTVYSDLEEWQTGFDDLYH